MTATSVVCPVGSDEDSDHVDRALRSVADQTLSPDEVVLVVDEDCPPALTATLEGWCDRDRRWRVVRSVGTSTIGGARQTGLEACEGSIVFLVDADDVSLPHRFERQRRFLERHPEVDAVGSYLAEFEDDPGAPERVRTVPTDHEAIYRRAKFANPVNQPTVAFRRERIRSVGGYRPVSDFEDYDLWVRALAAGLRFANLPEVLVRARAGPELFRRRGGLGYARREVQLQWTMREVGLIGTGRAVRNVLVRVPVRLLPTGARKAVYERFARERTDPDRAEPAAEGSDDGGTTWD